MTPFITLLLLHSFRSATYNRRTGDCALSDLDRRTAFGSTGSFIVSYFFSQFYEEA